MVWDMLTGLFYGLIIGLVTGLWVGYNFKRLSAALKTYRDYTEP